MKNLRVAVLCDYAEENWPSMDLVADRLLAGLVRDEDTGLSAQRVQPRMHARFSRCLPGRGGFNADRLMNRMVDYPLVARRLANFDLFHVVDHSYAQLVHALPPGRTVVTCHDADTFRCLFESAKEPRPYWFRAMSRHILRGLQRAAAIVCVSEATRQTLLRHGVAEPARLRVVHNGVDPVFSPEPDTYWDAEARRVLGPAVPPGYVLHVGSTVARKRIDVLLVLFAACRHERPELRLVHVGSPLTSEQRALVRALDLEDALRCLPFADRALLAALYRRAGAVTIPSDAEGFGLPLVESMACGTPAVASDIPALREVGGDAARYAPPGKIAAWTEAVLETLQMRDALQPACLERVQSFCWRRHAREVADLYRSVVSG